MIYSGIFRNGSAKWEAGSPDWHALARTGGVRNSGAVAGNSVSARRSLAHRANDRPDLTGAGFQRTRHPRHHNSFPRKAMPGRNSAVHG